MLKLSKDGAHITLKGQPSPSGDGLFWFASALLIGAVGVAMAMSLLPERLAIFALALLIVGSFIFNKMRQKTAKVEHANINTGKLEISQGQFIHHHATGKKCITLDNDDSIEIDGSKVDETTLKIVDGSSQPKYCISGFESKKEAQVMQAVLQGQKFAKRNANIKMQATESTKP